MLMSAVDTYLAVRRAAGYKLRDVEQYLRDFAHFATTGGDSHVVAQTAIRWATRSPSEAQRAERLSVVIRFARFAHAEDPRHEIPPERLFCSRHRRRVPYIFTAEEIQTLIAQAAQLGPPDSLRPHLYRTLFGLLAVTGLRISEALALRLKDITPDGLVVRETKFHKSRLLPVHETTTAALERYVAQRCQLVLDDDHLFVSTRRRPLCAKAARETFYQLLAIAGIPRAPGRPRPRLMDLRHTFATTVLAACPDDREHIRRHMLALSTYLGHAGIASTFWYLERTPQLMGDIAQRCEAFFGRADA
jgi:integrase/recombinase XerD